MYKYIAIIIIIILFSIFYIKYNINIWILNRQVRPFILKIINHPLYDAYKYSLNLEYNKKNNMLKNNSGFNRITPLINAPNKLYNVNDLMQEINNIIIYKRLLIENLIDEEIFITNKEYNKKLIEFYNQSETGKK